MRWGSALPLPYFLSGLFALLAPVMSPSSTSAKIADHAWKGQITRYGWATGSEVLQ